MYITASLRSLIPTLLYILTSYALCQKLASQNWISFFRDVISASMVQYKTVPQDEGSSGQNHNDIELGEQEKVDIKDYEPNESNKFQAPVFQDDNELNNQQHTNDDSDSLLNTPSVESFDLDFEEQGQDSLVPGRSTMKMAFMNMANAILGAGIIGQAFAFKNTGLVGGIIIMVILTGLIDWTLLLVVLNAEKSHTKLYQDTVDYCFGPAGRVVLLFSISSFAYGGCMAFCVIIGDTIPHVLKVFIPQSFQDLALGWILSRNSIIIIFTTCVSYPLSLNRDISKLAKASGFALVGMLTIIVMTVVRAPFVSPALKSETPVVLFNSRVFQGISVISFALVCHHNALFIYNLMKQQNPKKFGQLTHVACLISMACCLVMAINGVLQFGEKTKGNILNNFASDDNWINVARFCFGLNMLTTFPLELFVVRDVIKDILYREELTTKQHVIITSVLVFFSMSVSLFTCNLGLILELIGATSASLMAYIIPPLCHLKLCWNDFDSRSATRNELLMFVGKTVVPSLSCVLFGFSVMVISSYMSIRGGGGGSQCIE